MAVSVQDLKFVDIGNGGTVAAIDATSPPALLGEGYRDAFKASIWDQDYVPEEVVADLAADQTFRAAHVLACFDENKTVVGGANILPLSSQPKVRSRLPAALRSKSFYVKDLWVAPEAQDKKFGGGMLARIEQGVASMNVPRLILWTHHQCERLHAFYERHGYRAAGRTTSPVDGMPRIIFVKDVYVITRVSA